jgi:hypothetical protein
MTFLARAGSRLRRTGADARTLALVAAAGTLASVLVVLHGVVQVDGNPVTLFVLVGASLLAATVLSRVISAVAAFAIAAEVILVRTGVNQEVGGERAPRANGNDRGSVVFLWSNIARYWMDAST